MRIAVTILILFQLSIGTAQKTPNVQRVEPPFWWTGMKNKELQLLVYGTNIATSTPSFEYPGVTITSVDKVENPNYLFLNLMVSDNAKPGKFKITFQEGRRKKVVEYELKERATGSQERIGFNSSDVVYLITPDRFSNGDPSNDNIAGMKEMANRQEPYGRHGGDIQGIINHIPYLTDLGVTALWISPLQENDQPHASYHGYAITDFYNVDRRFGSNAQYVEMVSRCHEKGMKVIIDLVFNHSGSEHWFVKDLPEKNWIHQWPEGFTRSNYRISAAVDPYASEADKKKMFEGWFDTSMPDLAQENPRMLKYLTQNSIWWVEYANLDGIRMDTHPYNDKEAMAKWVNDIMTEYPNFNIVGEVLEPHVMYEAYWQKNSKNLDGYQGHLPSTLDVAVKDAMNAAFNENDGWDSGVSRIYYALTQDMIFTDAFNNLNFLDNHDLTRFATSVGGDINKMKMGIATLLTTRGIPQFYYGTEIMIPGPGDNHGILRADFPGGWAGDQVSVKDNKDLSPMQQEILDFSRTLLNWRKKSPVIHTGKLMQFVPENGIYVYFRYNDNATVMVILNNKNETQTLHTARFAERMNGFSSANDVIHNKRITNLQNIELAPKSATILELQK